MSALITTDCRRGTVLDGLEWCSEVGLLLRRFWVDLQISDSAKLTSSAAKLSLGVVLVVDTKVLR